MSFVWCQVLEEAGVVCLGSQEITQGCKLQSRSDVENLKSSRVESELLVRMTEDVVRQRIRNQFVRWPAALGKARTNNKVLKGGSATPGVAYLAALLIDFLQLGNSLQLLFLPIATVFYGFHYWCRTLGSYWNPSKEFLRNPSSAGRDQSLQASCEFANVYLSRRFNQVFAREKSEEWYHFVFSKVVSPQTPSYCWSVQVCQTEQSHTRSHKASQVL